MALDQQCARPLWEDSQLSSKEPTKRHLNEQDMQTNFEYTYDGDDIVQKLQITS